MITKLLIIVPFRTKKIYFGMMELFLLGKNGGSWLFSFWFVLSFLLNFGKLENMDEMNQLCLIA